MWGNIDDLGSVDNQVGAQPRAQEATADVEFLDTIGFEINRIIIDSAEFAADVGDDSFAKWAKIVLDELLQANDIARVGELILAVDNDAIGGHLPDVAGHEEKLIFAVGTEAVEGENLEIADVDDGGTS